MFKKLFATCLAVALLAVGAQFVSAQCGGQHGCRISNAFNGLVGNAYGGANCGREISQYEAQGLWAGYCNDNCSINSSCGGNGCGGGSGCGGFGGGFAPASAPVFAAPAVDFGGGFQGDCGPSAGCGTGGCLGKLKGLFASRKSNCGSGGCSFGYPSNGCGCNGGGCGDCGGGSYSGGSYGGGMFAYGGGGGFAGGGGCNTGCGGKLGGKLRGLFSGGCGCKLFSRGNFHDRAFSTFYASHGSASAASYFGGYVGPETGFADFTSSVNGQLSSCCGGGMVQGQAAPSSVMHTQPMQPTQSRVIEGTTSPILPGDGHGAAATSPDN